MALPIRISRMKQVTLCGKSGNARASPIQRLLRVFILRLESSSMVGQTPNLSFQATAYGRA